jgi:RNA polymerase sigma factor (sigma-70 family)
VTTDGKTDAELIDSAFAELFDRHAVAVHRYLARRIGPTTADDLLAQTFLVAFEGRAGYDRARPDARPWLYGIATNLLRRHRRDEVRQYDAWARTGVDPTAAPNTECHADRVAERADAEMKSPRLAAALAELKTPDRDALLLFAWCDLSYAEIAVALDIPVGTVRSRLNRARAIVRRALPDFEGEQ